MIRAFARWGVRIGVAVFALTLAAVVTLATEMRTDHLDGAALSAPVDALIVLGGRVDGDGRLGYSSRRRVEAAVRLLAGGQARAAIMTGGLGENHPLTPAASLMRAHAIEAGAAPEAVLVEPRSVSTFENLRLSFEIARERGLERLAVVSDPFHLPRAAALAAYFGEPEIGLVAAPGFDRESWYLRWAILAREAMAWWFNLLKVAGWSALGWLDIDPATRQGLVR
jgi:uncharacterized SAM-binding protein YcdF (DUF218 family)